MDKRKIKENKLQFSEMKKWGYSQFITLALIFIIVIVITIWLGIYINKVQNLTNENTLKSLSELTKQDVTKIENITNEHIRILETIVNEIEEKHVKTNEEAFKIFLRNSGSNQFSRMAIMYEDGKTYTSDGKTVDLSGEKETFFKNELVNISQTRKSKVDEEEINIYSKQTIINNQKVVILFVIETNKYEEIFIQSIYSGNGNEYIMTKEGKIIAKSNENIQMNDIDIYKIISGKIDNNNENTNRIENMKNDIQKENNNAIILNKGIKKYFITYQKININDWYLVIITNGSAVAEELNQVVIIIFIISITIIGIIIVFSLYIIVSQVKKRKELYTLAYIDPVTNLGNYNYFNLKGSKILENVKLKNKYIIVMDIAKFKNFNKKYGHEKGNELLNEIGKKIKEIFNENSIISRIANDYYAIFVYEINNIKEKIEIICKEISKICTEKNYHNIILYFGIYNIEKNNNIFQSFDKALMAHEKAKENKTEQFLVYNKEIEKQIERQQEIENVMQQALENNEFKIVYQPKIDLKSEKIIGAEALVRWHRKEKIIPPNEFIPIFEKNRFILKLDKYIFETVCKDIKKLEKESMKHLIISVNVSKENFYNEGFIKEYLEIATKYKINPNKIELEITETVTLSNEVNILEIIKNMKKVGFKVAIDDFGTGTSTLNMLQNMPIDTLKIDKVFVDKLNLNDKKSNIIEYIIYMAKKLNLQTVAEGVEKKEQVQYLQKLNCDLAQGYYYSKPITIIELIEYK